MKDKSKPEEALEAVVFADSFHPPLRLLPYSLALTPVGNVRLIDYTLEWLSRTPVKHVTIVSCRDAEKLRIIVQDGWSSRFASIVVVNSESSLSFGDAMRHLDASNRVKSDFLLVCTGALCSDPLDAFIAAHKERRARDKSCVLTLLAAEKSNSDLGDRFVFDSVTQRLLQFSSNRRRLTLSKDLFMFGRLSVRGDLADSQIALCSPQIPPLFSDNFDFQHRSDVIKEILTNEELLGFSAYVDILPEHECACSVLDYGSYLSLNAAVLERWTEPLVPDGLSLKGGVRYLCKGRFHYRPQTTENTIQIGEDVKLTGWTCLEKWAKVGGGAILRNAVLGTNSTVGENSHLLNCILFRDVSVGVGCRCVESLLFPRAELGNDVQIGPRCIIGERVKVPAGTVVPPDTVLLSRPAADGDDDFLSFPARKQGIEMDGFVWVWKEGKLWAENGGAPSQDESASSSELENTADFDEADVAQAVANGGQRLSEASSSDGPVHEDSKLFHEEVHESLHRGVEEKLRCEDLILEINSSKLAYNVSIKELCQLVTRAVLEIGCGTKEGTWPTLKFSLSHLTPVMKNYLKNFDSQMDCLHAIQDFGTIREDFVSLLPKTLDFLYDADVLEEESILEWAEGLDEPRLCKQVGPFIDWLKSAESEEDSD